MVRTYTNPEPIKTFKSDFVSDYMTASWQASARISLHEWRDVRLLVMLAECSGGFVESDQDQRHLRSVFKAADYSEPAALALYDEGEELVQPGTVQNQFQDQHYWVGLPADNRRIWTRKFIFRDGPHWDKVPGLGNSTISRAPRDRHFADRCRGNGKCMVLLTRPGNEGAHGCPRTRPDLQFRVAQVCPSFTDVNGPYNGIYLDPTCHTLFDNGGLALLPLGNDHPPYDRMLTFATVRVLSGNGDVGGRIFDPRVECGRQDANLPDPNMLRQHFAQTIMEAYRYSPCENHYGSVYMEWLWDMADCHPVAD